MDRESGRAIWTAEEVAARVADGSFSTDPTDTAEDVAGLLGADPDACTAASAGRVSQSVHVCLTCHPEGSAPAGFCYACRLKCHSGPGHEVIDLYWKRDFLCDCRSCGARAAESRDSRGNRYNHNFWGRYCICDGPYDTSCPDPMYECIVCEDWFHRSCIEKRSVRVREVADAFEDGDFVCIDCYAKRPVLWRYLAHLRARGIDARAQGPVTKPSAIECNTGGAALRDESNASPVARGTKRPAEQQQQQQKQQKQQQQQRGTTDAGHAPSESSPPPINTKKQRLAGDDVGSGVDSGVVDSGGVDSGGAGTGGAGTGAGTVPDPDPALASSATSVSAEEEGKGLGAAKVVDSAIPCTAPPEQASPGVDASLIPRFRVEPQFFPRGWRDEICRCARCAADLASEELSFLVDPSKWPKDVARSESECGENEVVDVVGDAPGGENIGSAGVTVDSRSDNTPTPATTEDSDIAAAVLSRIDPNQLRLGAAGCEALVRHIVESLRDLRDRGHTVITADDIHEICASLPNPGNAP